MALAPLSTGTSTAPRPEPHAPRLVLHLQGRAGNQLFQYAAGRLAALRLGANLLYYQDPKDKLACPNILPFFMCAARAASPRDLNHCLWPASKARGHKFRLCCRFLPRYADRFSVETLPDTAPSLRPQRPHHLSGFFQNRYAAEALGATLRQDLRLTGDMAPQRRHLLRSIRSGPCAAVHIRRGDYLLPEHQARFGTCSPEYYREAMDLLRSRHGVNTFFVFTDDPEWAQRHFAGNRHVQIVPPLGDGRDHEDILLMAACTHAITANSSFSWWGAFLNRSSRKIVIAPRVWFLDGTLDEEALLPPNWLRL